MGELIRFFKCTGPDGLAHHDGKTRYAVGERTAVERPDPPGAGACGQGLHVVSHLCHVSLYVDADKLRYSEFYEVEVDSTEVIASDETKTRVGALRTVRRLSERDFGIVRGRLSTVIGSGAGYGDGYGDGAGYGAGYGDGYGYGAGYGYGYGDGAGYGYGYGYGAGYGDGAGYGYGDGL